MIRPPRAPPPRLPQVDVIALGQFSLARAHRAVAAASGRPVLTTPDSAVRKLRLMLLAY